LTQYEIAIGGATKAVDLEQSVALDASKRENYVCKILGNTEDIRTLVVEERGRDVLLVSLDNKIFAVRQLRRTNSDVDFQLNGRRIHASLSNPISGSEESAVRSDVASENEIVTSNFPAKVVSIKVSIGNSLKKGDTLLVLEAMKMEAQIKAPKNCEIVEIFVHEGEMVPRGTKLIKLKFI
jgi:biotin carboxyl carrier protein